MIIYNLPEAPFATPRSTAFPALLQLIRFNDGLPIVVLNQDGSLFGVASSGDISSFVASNINCDFSQVSAEQVANKGPVVAHLNDDIATIEAYLSYPRIRCLPILDHDGYVIKVASQRDASIAIGRFRAGPKHPPLLIAEIGVNHNGDKNEALWLVEQASKGGCHAVKFQHRSTDLYSQSDINSYDIGTQYIMAEIERTKLSVESLEECSNLARKLDMEVIVTPFDKSALQAIMDSEINPASLKIASCDLLNFDLIRECASTRLPLILSTGMSFEREIRTSSDFVRSLMIGHAFLHCNSTYPAPPSDVNLSYIGRLEEITNSIIGYSSHDGDAAIPLAAIAKGAHIIEFHITRSKSSQGTDHRASIEVSRLGELSRSCALIHEAIGQSLPRTPTQGELANRQALGKSWVVRSDLSAGHDLSRADMVLASPGTGYSVNEIDQLIGKRLVREVKAFHLVQPSDINPGLCDAFDNLNSAVVGLNQLGYIPGIPVRYHDAQEMQEIFGLSLLEFHMSDRDLGLKPIEFLSKSYPEVDLIVHAVEQYEDGFILDLASGDKDILKRSYNEINRLCSHIDRLRQLFIERERIPVVLNIGGFTPNSFLNHKDYHSTLDRAVNSLQELTQMHFGYQFLPQTMPPFPWHQGGRSFHNLLTSRAKVKDFLERTDLEICLDVSHTALSCSYFGEEIEDHIHAMSGRIKHLHLSDAQGLNAEGLEIGYGSINFRELHQALMKQNKLLYMIPEIWQGHLRNGQKFARALVRYHDRIC